ALREKLKYLCGPNSGLTTKNSGGKLSLVWDRCRCYRHFGTRSRSIGIAGFRKGTGNSPGAGRRHWVFRRSGFPIVEAYNRRAHSGLLLGWFVVPGQSWVGFSLVSSSWSTSSKVSTLGTLSRPNFWRFPVREFTRPRL